MDALHTTSPASKRYRLLSHQRVVVREITLKEEEVGSWLSAMMTHFGWQDVRCERSEQSVDFVEFPKA